MRQFLMRSIKGEVHQNLVLGLSGGKKRKNNYVVGDAMGKVLVKVLPWEG